MGIEIDAKGLLVSLLRLDVVDREIFLSPILIGRGPWLGSIRLIFQDAPSLKTGFPGQLFLP